MLRTTTKAAKQNIMNYIRDNSIDYLMECGYITESANDTDICKAIIETFHNEYGWAVKRYGTQKAFETWAAGLACGSLFDYYLHSAVNDLGNILEETETERNRYTEEKAETMLTWLIFREVTKKAVK